MPSTTSVEVAGGIVSPQVTVALLEAAQTSGTHVGTSSADFSLQWGGGTVEYRVNQVFIADALLYAAINASTTASANITWAD